MNWFHLLYELPALVAGTTLVSFASPVKIAHRALPLVMFLMALVVLYLPVVPDVALALTLPAAILANFLGISFTEHEPVDVAPVVSCIRSLHAGISKVKKTKPVEVTEFATRAYPAPGEAETGDLEPADGAPVAEDDQDDEPVASPEEQAREHLAKLAGLHSQTTTPVRKYVPSLI